MNEFLLAILKFIIPFVVMVLFIGGFAEAQPTPTVRWHYWGWGVSLLFALLVFLFADFLLPAFVS